MSEQGQTTQYGVELRPVGGTRGAAQDNTYQANVGEAFSLQAVIIVYENGEPVGEVDPIAVQWEFGGASRYLSSFQPTVAQADADLDVNLQANPVQLYYWAPEVLGGTSVVPIVCIAEAPDGTSLQEEGQLTLVANPYVPGGMVQGEIQLQQLPNGNTLLSYGDSLGEGEPGLALAYNTAPGAAYGGWLGAIQLVSSVRQFTGQSGQVYTLSNTNGNFVLDGSAAAQDFIYSKEQVAEGGVTQYTFDDSPNQELLPVINGDPITQFTVDETFALFFVYNGSATEDPNDDPTQIWFPITVFIEWGWQATVANDGENVWNIVTQQVTDPTPMQLVMPGWEGTVSNLVVPVDPARIAALAAPESAVL